MSERTPRVFHFHDVVTVPCPPRPERVVAAAIRLSNSLVLSLPQPARHGDVIGATQAARVPQDDGHVQGFLTDRGRFVDREVAWRIARAARQPKLGHDRQPQPWPARDGHLLSEDLW